MSTLNEPICSSCSIAPTYPSRSHFEHTLNRESRIGVRINVAVPQEKENEEAGKREAEEGKQLTDFRGAACYSSAVVQRAARRKNDSYKGSALDK